ncbi:MAG: DNA primase [Verrucomicrobiaceae bacterium]|nr:DNA primase [Verrucomicrobiaceae bacterium]
MGLIPESTIQEILGATDIVELVEGYFPLQKKGQDFWAVCPFHSEKSPSFKVSPSRQAYYCFGCNAKGSAIGFVMEYENLDYPSAIRRLAERVSITIKESEDDPQARAAAKQRAQLLQLHKTSSDWFHNYLMKGDSHDAESARKYLKDRGLGADIANRWNIGFAPANGDLFAQWARENKYSGRLMSASGLMSLREENNPSRGLYTRFRDRIMFPLNNDFGETVAFSGRIIDPNAKTAKYVNSPETELFSKSKIFFGLDKSKRAIAKSESVIICEGQLDMIRCYENGIENAVAPLGTAFTEHHSRTLRRFAGDRAEALLCFDSDSAGYKASVRAYKSLSASGIFVRAVNLPPGEDPDSLITSKGADAFRLLIDNARPFYHFQIDQLNDSLDINDPRDRVSFANELAPSISVIADPVAREAMINEVATRLGIAATDFRTRVANSVKQDQNFSSSRHSDPKDHHAQLIVEDADARILIRLALTHEDTREWMKETRQESMAHIQEIPSADLLQEIWENPPESTQLNVVNAYLATLPNEKEHALRDVLVARFANLELADAKRALLRLRIRALELARDTTKTKAAQPNLSKSQILDLTSNVESQRKELLDLKIALKNIASHRA